MPSSLSLTASAPLSLASLLINLGVGVVLSILLRWHFQRFSSTFSNREEFGQVCPFVMLTTILIITVVKSSLALSLGLVGALSIVRFRTPIKEPEELAYLFIAIAMGLGLGADQTLPTCIAGPLILGVMALFKWVRQDRKNKNLYLSIDWENEAGQSDQLLEKINSIIEKHVILSDLRRVDAKEHTIATTYYIDIESHGSLSALMNELQGAFAGVSVTFIDQNQVSAV